MSTKKVLVTGATGRTGSLVVEKLLKSEDFRVVGFARSPEKVKELFGTTNHFHFGDIRSKSDLRQALSGCQALVILTSAVPQVIAAPKLEERPIFEYLPNGTPELVDYEGQKNQIDCALEAGVEHIVLVGSMGGTNENHPLNKMGNGKILIWKRKAEEYLVNSGLDYTIIRAGGLMNKPGGERELLVGNDDQMLINTPNDAVSSVPRADVAETVVQALKHLSARNKAFDLISKTATNSQGSVTKDFASLFTQATAAKF